MLPPACKKNNSATFSTYFSRSVCIRRLLCSNTRLRKPPKSSPVSGFSFGSDIFSRFLTGDDDGTTCDDDDDAACDDDDDDACDDVIGATNTLPIEVRTSFGDVASTTLVEFCRAGDGCGDDAPTTLTLAGIALPTAVAALRDWVFAILTILVTATCCAFALVVELFGITCEWKLRKIKSELVMFTCSLLDPR